MSHRRISLNAEVWSLSWPMILANLSIPLFGLVDTAVLGHLPDGRYLSSVAIGASLLSLCYWAFGFLRMGTTGASAQSRPEDSGALLLKALGTGLALGIALTIAGPAIRHIGLPLMNASPALQPLADDYLFWRFFGAPAVLCSYAIGGWLLGQGQARWPLLIAVCGNSANILLDLLLIVGLDMHSTGAALASTTSEYLALSVGLWAVRHPLSQAISNGFAASLRRGPPMSQFAKSNFQIFIRTASLLFLEAPLLDTMTSIPEVRSRAGEFYGWLVVLPLVSAACYSYDGIFIGSLRTTALQYCMLISVFGVYLPIWHLSRDWGNHGLWFAFTSLNIARGVTLALCFQWLFAPEKWPQ